jgi:diaminopimelate epimerase
MDGLAIEMAGDNRETVAMIKGRHFWKMTGSGNDFVFVDGRGESATEFETADVIQRVCARGTGVGADGLVILSDPRSADADLAITYFNADGSLASLCGNATLCTASLGARLRAVDAAGFGLETGSGVLRARVLAGVPEFDLPAIREPQASLVAIQPAQGEQRLGFATAGIPHVVIRVPDVSASDVANRGRAVRYDGSLQDGANVNFVSGGDGQPWKIRTYERGVEGETLACGTGSVATAILLRLWGEAGNDVELQTASGQLLGIRSSQAPDGSWTASLRGEGRLVFEGDLGDL